MVGAFCLQMLLVSDYGENCFCKILRKICWIGSRKDKRGLVCFLSKSQQWQLVYLSFSGLLFCEIQQQLCWSDWQVIIAAELLKNADELVKAKIHPTSVISGYRLACKYEMLNFYHFFKNHL